MAFFYIFDHNHPSLTSLRPKDLENDKKIFLLHPSLAEIFDINRKTCFFRIFSEWSGSGIGQWMLTKFTAYSLDGVLKLQKKNWISKSKTMVSGN